jgi:hypothetical protein
MQSGTGVDVILSAAGRVPDWPVALEATGNALRIAGLLEPH